MLFEYNNMQWVPVGIEGEAVCCCAVIKEDESNIVNKEFNVGYTHTSAIGTYRGGVFCLTDEYILLHGTS
jgi:hypothetical protein